jgi:thiol-disulfide isomerase/thioredoxin
MRLPSLPVFLAALRDPKRWRKWLTEVAVIIALVSGVTLWQNRGLPEGPAPELAGVRTDGRHANLAEGSGTRLVVFWATWCPICKGEAGNIEAIAADWPVVSVAMQSGAAASVTQYLQDKRLTVPAIVDDSGNIAAAWRVRGVPTHFVIDPAGNIRFRVVGYATEIGLRVRLWWANRFPLT